MSSRKVFGQVLRKLKKTMTFWSIRAIVYSSMPGHRSCQIETAVWNWSGFFTVLSKPAGSDLGSFLMIYRNWVSVFFIKKPFFLIKNLFQKLVFLTQNVSKKTEFFLNNRSANRSSLSKIGLEKSVFLIKNQSCYGGCRNSLAGVAVS